MSLSVAGRENIKAVGSKNASKTFVGDHWEEYWGFVGMGWDSRCALGIGPGIGGKILKLGVGIGITKTGIGQTLLPGLCFGGNRQRLLRHFRRLKHEPVREKAAKNVFAGVFAQIESMLLSSENRYRDSEPHCFRIVFSLYANRNKAPKICCAFLFSLGYISLLTFLRVVSQFSHRLPLVVDRSFLRHRLFMVSAAFNFKRRSFKSHKRKRIKATSS